ncbi:MAG: FecR family protein [Bacteroidales bacterium]
MIVDRKHIDKIFRGGFSLKDKKIVEEYFKDASLDEDVKKIVEEQWDNFEHDEHDITDLEHIFYKIFFEIRNSKRQGSRGLAFFLKRIAVVLVVLLLLGGAFYWGAMSSSDTKTLSVEFHSPEGMRSQFKLPDGTTGWLGHNSDLRYEVDGKTRLVHMDGQAYFDVAHSEDSAFVVCSPMGYDVRVHGTNFNVNSYSVENNFEVVLEEGSVSVESGNKLIDIIKPNEKISYDNSKASFSKSLVSPSDYTAWKDGRLSINYEPFEQSCEKIGRFYNVEFGNIPDELKTQNVRLILEGESLEEALHIITQLYPVKYKITDRMKLDDGSYSKRKVIISMK